MSILPIIQRVKEDFKQNLFFKAIPRKAIPEQDEINSLNAMEEVIFVGYPNGMWDSIHNLPILRKGITLLHHYRLILKIDLNS